ncbi:MAG: hypothetical protein GX140_01450 [Bacteroidales bacterium]|nr:hypothetical protein [Bacteroidales bacterium]
MKRNLIYLIALTLFSVFIFWSCVKEESLISDIVYENNDGFLYNTKEANPGGLQGIVVVRDKKWGIKKCVLDCNYGTGLCMAGDECVKYPPMYAYKGYLFKNPSAENELLFFLTKDFIDEDEGVLIQNNELIVDSDFEVEYDMAIALGFRKEVFVKSGRYSIYFDNAEQFFVSFDVY